MIRARMPGTRTCRCGFSVVPRASFESVLTVHGVHVLRTDCTLRAPFHAPECTARTLRTWYTDKSTDKSATDPRAD